MLRYEENILHKYKIDLIRDGKQAARPFFGRLNMFIYDPKLKKKLPYYDTFPLVLPVDTFRGGFVGLNFHYLPYIMRFRLLQEIQRYASNTQFDSTTKIMATYSTCLLYTSPSPRDRQKSPMPSWA